MNYDFIFVCQGFVRIDMSEYQEKHEVSVHCYKHLRC